MGVEGLPRCPDIGVSSADFFWQVGVEKYRLLKLIACGPFTIHIFVRCQRTLLEIKYFFVSDVLTPYSLFFSKDGENKRLNNTTKIFFNISLLSSPHEF